MQRGLYVLLGTIAGYALFGTFAALGFAAVAVNLFTPLPAAFVGMRVGSAAAGVTVALTAFLVLLTADSASSVMYLVQFGIPGVALPWLLNRGFAWDKAAVAVLWAMVAASLCGLLVVSAVSGQSPLVTVSDLIGKEIVQTTTIMQEVFMLSLLARGRYTVPGRAFPEWKSPEWLVWILITSGFLVAFVEGIAGTFALNLLVILLPVYFLQGLAVIDCFFRRKAFSPIIRTVGYLLVTLVNPLPMVVTGIGVFDLWADFRKPKEPES